MKNFLERALRVIEEEIIPETKKALRKVIKFLEEQFCPKETIQL